MLPILFKYTICVMRVGTRIKMIKVQINIIIEFY